VLFTIVHRLAPRVARGVADARPRRSSRLYFACIFAAWHAAWSGVASERDWVFALAVFLTLRGESAADLQPFLKPHLSSDLAKAMAYLKRNPSPLAALRSQ
jgi:hypothetical protein